MPPVRTAARGAASTSPPGGGLVACRHGMKFDAWGISLQGNPYRTTKRSLQNDLNHRIKCFLERALICVCARMFALNIDYAHLRTQWQESHMPSAQLDIDAITPVINKGFHLFKVFRTVQIDRGWGHHHQTRFAAQWDECLSTLDVSI